VIRRVSWQLDQGLKGLHSQKEKKLLEGGI